MLRSRVRHGTLESHQARLDPCCKLRDLVGVEDMLLNRTSDPMLGHLGERVHMVRCKVAPEHTNG